MGQPASLAHGSRWLERGATTWPPTTSAGRTSGSAPWTSCTRGRAGRGACLPGYGRSSMIWSRRPGSCGATGSSHSTDRRISPRPASTASYPASRPSRPRVRWHLRSWALRSVRAWPHCSWSSSVETMPHWTRSGERSLLKGLRSSNRFPVTRRTGWIQTILLGMSLIVQSSRFRRRRPSRSRTASTEGRRGEPWVRSPRPIPTWPAPVTLSTPPA